MYVCENFVLESDMSNGTNYSIIIPLCTDLELVSSCVEHFVFILQRPNILPILTLSVPILANILGRRNKSAKSA